MSSSPPPKLHRPRLLDELRASRREFIKTYGPGIFLTFMGFAIALYFVEPPPPDELVIATGKRDGNYYAVAQQYAEVFHENGVKLTIRETAGSVENYGLLLHDDSVDLAIVQGGTVPENADLGRLESLATLYLEPVWVFYRGDQIMDRLAQLSGKRIAVGVDGSGTQMLAESLLQANGVRDGFEATVFVKQGGSPAAELLKAGEIDVGFFVLSAETPLVHDLLKTQPIELMNFERGEAYARRYSFLQSVKLEQGVLDLRQDLPRHQVQLIAPAANLVATRKLHDAFIPLLMEAATRTRHLGGLLTDPGDQPSLSRVEFPPSAVARHYLQYGPSFSQKHLSFWVASLIDRTKIMLLPFLLLLIPLVKLAPPVYRWRIRSRIYRWYAVLRQVDQALRDGKGQELSTCEEKLNAMERELVEVNVPLSYMEEFYSLRLHIDLIKRRLELRQQESATT